MGEGGSCTGLQAKGIYKDDGGGGRKRGMRREKEAGRKRFCVCLLLWNGRERQYARVWMRLGGSRELTPCYLQLLGACGKQADHVSFTTRAFFYSLPCLHMARSRNCLNSPPFQLLCSLSRRFRNVMKPINVHSDPLSAPSKYSKFWPLTKSNRNKTKINKGEHGYKKTNCCKAYIPFLCSFQSFSVISLKPFVFPTAINPVWMPTMTMQSKVKGPFRDFSLPVCLLGNEKWGGGVGGKEGGKG